ncbi:MAG: methyltransferase domain-containing protein [Candidatus Lokiarchaeota archaeon]|nr:methyltransferase domain-containing protein [Candidatus Lokiarchaeota archaeon]
MIKKKTNKKSLAEISRMVATSYDIIGHDYHSTRRIHKIDAELQKFSDLLPLNARVLDAGSGSGVPTSKYLSEQGHQMIGIDISDGMLEMAQKNVPDGRFVKMNMTDLKFDDDSFDGVVSLFAIFHIPRTQHHLILSEFHRVLKKGGILVINQGAFDMDGISRFFGEPMMWSNYKPEKTLTMVKEYGFEIIFEGNLVRGGETQYWIFARKKYDKKKKSN